MAATASDPSCPVFMVGGSAGTVAIVSLSTSGKFTVKLRMDSSKLSHDCAFTTVIIKLNLIVHVTHLSYVSESGSGGLYVVGQSGKQYASVFKKHNL